MVSPGPVSLSVPSSITTFILPEITYIVWGAWQLEVLAIGLTHFSQLHPGSNTALPIVISPKFATSIFPLSNVRVSSGAESKFFFCILADVVVIILVLNSLIISISKFNERLHPELIKESIIRLLGRQLTP